MGGSKGGGWGVGEGGEMTQTLYAHMNKKKKKKNPSMIEAFLIWPFLL
jgi:hypothetical protein